MKKLYSNNIIDAYLVGDLDGTRNPRSIGEFRRRRVASYTHTLGACIPHTSISYSIQSLYFPQRVLTSEVPIDPQLNQRRAPPHGAASARAISGLRTCLNSWVDMFLRGAVVKDCSRRTREMDEGRQRGRRASCRPRAVDIARGRKGGAPCGFTEPLLPDRHHPHRTTRSPYIWLRPFAGYCRDCVRNADGVVRSERDGGGVGNVGQYNLWPSELLSDEHLLRCRERS